MFYLDNYHDMCVGARSGAGAGGKGLPSGSPWLGSYFTPDLQPQFEYSIFIMGYRVLRNTKSVNIDRLLSCYN